MKKKQPEIVLTRRIFVSHAWPSEPSGHETQPYHQAIEDLLRHAGIDPDQRIASWVKIKDPIQLEASSGETVVLHLEVFYDQCSLAPFDHVDNKILNFLEQSHLFVACWSASYPTRSACMWEYISAYFSETGSQRPGRRVAILPIDLDRVGPTIRPSLDLQPRLLPDLMGCRSGISEIAQSHRGHIEKG